MDRLHALDAAFLELEEPGPAVAVGVAAILDGPCPPVSEVRAMVADRLPGMHRLAQRVVPDPSGLRRPTWVDVPDLDLAEHVTAVRAAGGDLEAVVSARIATAMRHDRPLWDLAVVRDLPDRRWALVWRVHHTIADGVGAMILLGHAFDLDPSGSAGTLADAVLAARVLPGGREPGPADAHPHSLAAQAVSAVESAGGGLARLVGRLPGVARTAADAAPRPPSPLTGPLSDRRRWVSATAPVAAAKVARRAFGGTVNDVVLAAVTSGYRDLLLARGEDVSGRRVRVLIPVNLRPGDDGSSDNQVSAMIATLPVGEPDPVRRLADVAATTRRLKEVGAPIVGTALLGLVDGLVPSAVQDAVVSHAVWVPEWFVETIVTNVPGPQFPLWVMGRPVRTLTPMIPLGGHLRVIVGVVSYDGDLDIGVTGDGEHARDVDVVAAGIAAGVRELARLAGEREGVGQH
jgi:diacylglycerol O-acyltransferase / wax synthase